MSISNGRVIEVASGYAADFPHPRVGTLKRIGTFSSELEAQARLYHVLSDVASEEAGGKPLQLGGLSALNRQRQTTPAVMQRCANAFRLVGG